MKTPICDFVNEYKKSGKLRLHMPGHKGNAFLGIEDCDITEISGADVLYHADGIIKRSEENASELFGTAKTVYSAEGSSLAIRAMLYLARLCGKKPLVAAGRNAHKVFMTACALLDVEIAWIFPENKGNMISCEISPAYLDEFLCSAKEKPSAVYITSPDYLGNVADIKGLSAVCKKHGVLLAVDNAHGAYLNFLPENMHPIALGADICCDSAHKTLPVLTGGAYLHISKNAPKEIYDNAENAMSVFASTSPSYLILQSLDGANAYLDNGYREKLADYIKSVDALKEKLSASGYELIGTEPLKLTVSPKSYGYKGYELADILSVNGIECEFSDPDFVVMMFTPENGKEAIKAVENALFSVEKKAKITDLAPEMTIPEKAMSLREALLCESEEFDIHQCLGRITASAAVTCPPAIPVVVCGEKIDKNAIKLFEYYGVSKIRVVKNNIE